MTTYKGYRADFWEFLTEEFSSAIEATRQYIKWKKKNDYRADEMSNDSTI